jgi:hypothetical protein
MGMFHLKEVHHNMETTRTNFFFWHGLVNKNKYHMMKWEGLDSPKKEVGSGFTNTIT